MAALLLGCKLVFEVDARGPGLDHGFHQLEHIEGAAETGLGVGHDGREPVGVVFAFRVVNLVGALEGLIDPAHDMRDAVGGVQALVGVHMPGEVGVSRDLPATVSRQRA